MSRKTIAITLILVGAVLILASGFYLLDKLTAKEPVGLGTWLLNILTLALGAGTGLGGWKELRKARKEGTRIKDQRSQVMIDTERSQQYMEGKGGVQKQQIKGGSDNKQSMK